MLKEKLETIILNEKDIIPFLKKLTPKDKKSLVPFLMEFEVKVNGFDRIENKGKDGGYSLKYKQHYSDDVKKLFNKAVFICCSKTEISKLPYSITTDFVSDDYIENILPWYTPRWYSEMIHKDTPWGLTYKKMMSMSYAGYFSLSHELIISRLPNAIIEEKGFRKTYERIYNPDLLLEYEVTLKDHLWLLFEEETGINNYYDFLNVTNYKGGNSIWIDTIVKLVEKKSIDRKKTLIATIYTSTKGFNKNLSGWFIDLLVKLDPTQDEILDLQSELYASLNSPHSKVVNTILKYFKPLLEHNKFDYSAFLDCSTILINSETKSVVNTTLMMLEKLAKLHKHLHSGICTKVTEALLNLDEKIQVRAAKLIMKYGDPTDQELIDQVNMYSEHIFHTPKIILKEYIFESEDLEPEAQVIEKVNVFAEDNKLPNLTSFDELLFFISQSIDNNEVYHIDLLLNYLPKLNALIDDSKISKLESIFKRALDLTTKYDWSNQIGQLEVMGASLINDFANLLLVKYPTALANFKKYQVAKVKNAVEDIYFKETLINKLKEIENQSIPDYVYQIHRALFIKSKELITNDLQLDLLSTPTHAPCWLSPEVLVNRIISYEEQEEEMNLYDFQVAIGRLPTNYINVMTLPKFDQIKNKDIKNVLSYHFGDLDINSFDKAKPEVWIQSVLCKNNRQDIEYIKIRLNSTLQNELDKCTWFVESVDDSFEKYDNKTKKSIPVKYFTHYLQFEKEDLTKIKNRPILKNLMDTVKNINTVEFDSIYSCMKFKKGGYWTHNDTQDMVKFLLISPNYPNKILRLLTKYALNTSDFFDEDSRKLVINSLKALSEIWNRNDFNESTYLFLCACILCNDKVARDLAAGIWINAVYRDNMNNVLLGTILGKLEYNPYAPLKRFTDLIASSLFNISIKHNESLFTVLDNMICKMNNEPIRGLKKLLELFLELKIILKSKTPQQSTTDKLLIWSETKSLNSVIKKIENV